MMCKSLDPGCVGKPTFAPSQRKRLHDSCGRGSNSDGVLFSGANPFFLFKKGGSSCQEKQKFKNLRFRAKTGGTQLAASQITTTAEEEKTNKNDWTG